MSSPPLPQPRSVRLPSHLAASAHHSPAQLPCALHMMGQACWIAAHDEYQVPVLHCSRGSLTSTKAVICGRLLKQHTVAPPSVPLSCVPPQVWSRFVQFEATYGDLSSLLKVEKRRREALAAAGERVEVSLEALVRRYRFMDLWPAAPHELALMHPHQVRSHPHMADSYAQQAARLTAGGKMCPVFAIRSTRVVVEEVMPADVLNAPRDDQSHFA